MPTDGCRWPLSKRSCNAKRYGGCVSRRKSGDYKRVNLGFHTFSKPCCVRLKNFTGGVEAERLRWRRDSRCDGDALLALPKEIRGMQKPKFADEKANFWIEKNLAC
uniref:Uncharacterized protein n=1 Tax=Romanomermis culicivorax TaxID=13658 RepID=A0A915L6C1_ROMCU